MNGSWRWLALGLALACSQAAQAGSAPVVVIDHPEARFEALRDFEVLADPTASLRLEDVASAPGWGPPPPLQWGKETLVYWVRLRIESRLPQAEEFTVFPDSSWERADLYVPEPPLSWRVERSGWGTALADRPLPYARPAFQVSLPPGEARTFYLRLQSHPDDYLTPESLALGLQPWSSFHPSDLRVRHFQGIYAGLIAAMLVYNLFLFFAVHDRTYLLYVLHAATFGLIWIARSGQAFEILWPSWPRWEAVSSFYVIAAAVVCGGLFGREFLHTRTQVPRLHAALVVLSAVVGIPVLLGLLRVWWPATQLLAYISLITGLAYLAAGVIVQRQGYRPARIFLVACGFLIAGTIAHVLMFLGVLQRSFASLYAAQIGSAAEVLLLAFALGDRINILKREKDEAEAVYRSGLEREVRERTSDLAEEKSRLEQARLEAEESNRRLHEANERLARISFVDELTGVANRRHFESVLDEEWRRCSRAGLPLSVILLDVDHFKDYNDHFGHPAGDLCLQRVVGALAHHCLRAGDLIARYGGEEFVVVLPGTERSGAVLMAERLRGAVEALAIPHAPLVTTPVVTISAGVGSIHPSQGAPATDLLAEADRALYDAKRQGRNCVVPAPLMAELPFGRETPGK